MPTQQQSTRNPTKTFQQQKTTIKHKQQKMTTNTKNLNHKNKTK